MTPSLPPPGLRLGREGAPPPMTSMLPDILRPGGGPAFFAPRTGTLTMPVYLLFSLTGGMGISRGGTSRRKYCCLCVCGAVCGCRGAFGLRRKSSTLTLTGTLLSDRSFRCRSQ
ncbi:unnamed protein product, partial [Ixodes hexagonus]